MERGVLTGSRHFFAELVARLEHHRLGVRVQGLTNVDTPLTGEGLALGREVARVEPIEKIAKIGRARGGAADKSQGKNQ